MAFGTSGGGGGGRSGGGSRGGRRQGGGGGDRGGKQGGGGGKKYEGGCDTVKAILKRPKAEWKPWEQEIVYGHIRSCDACENLYKKGEKKDPKGLEVILPGFGLSPKKDGAKAEPFDREMLFAELQGANAVSRLKKQRAEAAAEAERLKAEAARLKAIDDRARKTVMAEEENRLYEAALKRHRQAASGQGPAAPARPAGSPPPTWEGYRDTARNWLGQAWSSLEDWLKGVRDFLSGGPGPGGQP